MFGLGLVSNLFGDDDKKKKKKKSNKDKTSGDTTALGMAAEAAALAIELGLDLL